MDLELRDKVAVVTGASKGIGLAVVKELVAEGALVVAGARTSSALEGSRASRRSRSTSPQPDGPARLVAHAIERHGSVDVLVNNVGARAHAPRRLPRVPTPTSSASMQLNFYSALRATRAAVTDMLDARRRRDRQRRLGQRVLPARRRRDRLRRGQGGAGQLRQGAVAGVRRRSGIRVNNVSPGPVATDLWLGEDGVAATVAGATGATPRTWSGQRDRGGMPTGRFTTPAEVATLVALLASPRTGNVTGADYVIDGGLIKTA